MREILDGKGLGESTPADPFGDQFCPLTPFLGHNFSSTAQLPVPSTRPQNSWMCSAFSSANILVLILDYGP
jgi:hypothetical protein